MIDRAAVAAAGRAIEKAFKKCETQQEVTLVSNRLLDCTTYQVGQVAWSLPEENDTMHTSAGTTPITETTPDADKTGGKPK